MRREPSRDEGRREHADEMPACDLGRRVHPMSRRHHRQRGGGHDKAHHDIGRCGVQNRDQEHRLTHDRRQGSSRPFFSFSAADGGARKSPSNAIEINAIKADAA